MKDGEIYYLRIAKYIKMAIPIQAIDEWEYAILYITHSHGTTATHGEYYLQSNEGNLQVHAPDFDLDEVLDSLQTFTTANNYVPWNKIVFKLYANNKFEIEYIWDQAHHDQQERWAQGNYDDLEDDLE